MNQDTITALLRQNIDTLSNDSISAVPTTITLDVQNDTVSQIHQVLQDQDTTNFHHVSESKLRVDTFDNVQLIPIQMQEEIVPIKEKGILIVRTLRTENGMVATLLGCFFLLAFLLSRSKRFLSQQFNDFMLHRERPSIFVVSGAIDVRYSILLILQTCIFTGFCLFYYFRQELPKLTELYSSLFLIGIYVCACLIYLFFKWIIYIILGWVFFDKSKSDLWGESYSTLIYFLGFALFPFILLLVYLDLLTIYIVIVGAILIGIIKILMFYKWIKLFPVNIYGFFLIFLYFCALEIIPLFLLYEELNHLNNVLLINS